MLAAFRQVTQRSNARDGLPCRHHASVRPVQCRSPSDPSHGSSHAPASAPRESWVKDFRAGSSHRNAARRQQKRRAALASSKATAHNGMWCPVLAAIHWSRYGAPGEQQHLPDWSHHSNKEWRPGAKDNALTKGMTHAQETQHPAERKDGPRASAGAARGPSPARGRGRTLAHPS